LRKGLLIGLFAGRPKAAGCVLPIQEGTTVPDNLSELIEELVLANRILSNEGVLDGLGHVSVRHPTDPGRYLLSRARAALVVEPADILEYTLDSEPVKRSTTRPYSERVIHGCIYQARSDVMAVCHNHAPALMPFCVAGKAIVPVSHVGATMGDQTPFWDQADEFGDTNLLVVKPEEGQSLARALGRHSVVLMRRHGATVVASSLKAVVSRSIFLCQNAEYQMRAYLLGTPTPLRPGEIKPSGDGNLSPGVIARNWEYWVRRLELSGAWPLAAHAAPIAITEKDKRRR
jgi:ribulose-5-phosphate 4-epimerase/fuculose-1-phosphate aldolase